MNHIQLISIYITCGNGYYRSKLNCDNHHVCIIDPNVMTTSYLKQKPHCIGYLLGRQLKQELISTLRAY